jgi:hypothetical protein
MPHRYALGIIALALALSATDMAVQAQVAAKYPDWSGQKVLWSENSCTLGNDHLAVGSQDYMISADGYLMPVRKDQAPPDLRYFTRARK